MNSRKRSLSVVSCETRHSAQELIGIFGWNVDEEYKEAYQRGVRCRQLLQSSLHLKKVEWRGACVREWKKAIILEGEAVWLSSQHILRSYPALRLDKGKRSKWKKLLCIHGSRNGITESGRKAAIGMLATADTSSYWSPSPPHVCIDN